MSLPYLRPKRLSTESMKGRAQTRPWGLKRQSRFGMMSTPQCRYMESLLKEESDWKDSPVVFTAEVQQQQIAVLNLPVCITHVIRDSPGSARWHAGHAMFLMHDDTCQINRQATQAGCMIM